MLGLLAGAVGLTMKATADIVDGVNDSITCSNAKKDGRLSYIDGHGRERSVATGHIVSTSSLMECVPRDKIIYAKAVKKFPGTQWKDRVMFDVVTNEPLKNYSLDNRNYLDKVNAERKQKEIQREIDNCEYTVKNNQLYASPQIIARFNKGLMSLEKFNEQVTNEFYRATNYEGGTEYNVVHVMRKETNPKPKALTPKEKEELKSKLLMDINRATTKNERELAVKKYKEVFADKTPTLTPEEKAALKLKLMQDIKNAKTEGGKALARQKYEEFLNANLETSSKEETPIVNGAKDKSETNWWSRKM